MVAHAITIDVSEQGPIDQYRWRCSCGKSGEWRPRVRQARQGGGCHVAAMERGKR